MHFPGVSIMFLKIKESSPEGGARARAHVVSHFEFVVVRVAVVVDPRNISCPSVCRRLPQECISLPTPAAAPRASRKIAGQMGNFKKLQPAKQHF
jgi:hypothetical protein